jgi:D-arabinose 1-dehydrogenase-like Zn-dependent alcohol dehydrogenase
VNCHNGKITGFTHDGGYAEDMVTPAQALAAIPDGLSFVDAAPLMCAGVTIFHALQHSGAMPGDLVAIQAIGGLGHLAVQFASKFGYRTVAISCGDDAKDLALKLGAHTYINSDATNPAEELQRMGGAKTILSTAPSGKAMSSVIDGLGDNGKLMVIGASAEPIEITPIQLIKSMRSIQGWAPGVAADSESALGFSALTEAYNRMMSGKARFRVVLTIGQAPTTGIPADRAVSKK